MMKVFGATYTLLLVSIGIQSVLGFTPSNTIVSVPTVTMTTTTTTKTLHSTTEQAATDATRITDVGTAMSNWQVDETFTKTDSGLYYKDIKEGSGESPEDEGSVEFNYEIRFDDFATDDSGKLYFKTSGQPIGFQVGNTQIVKGWVEGMQTMKEGGKRILIVPPELGYGEQGLPKAGSFPAIPSNSYLRFELDLVKVDNSDLTKFRRKIPKPSAIFDSKQSWFNF